MVECSEICELLFEKLPSKLVARRKLIPSVADSAKTEYSDLITFVVKENRNEFLSFKKETDRLDNFFWKFIGGRSQFSNLKNVFQILLIISHGQGQVERGFSTNKQLLDHNMFGKILIVQRIIEDHMRIHNLQPQQLQMTHKLMEYVKGARKNYFVDQRKRSLSKIQNEKEVQKEKINEEIETFSQQIKLLESTIVQLNADADQFALGAEKKVSLKDIKSTITKSNALKRAATEKQEALDQIAAKRKVLVERKLDI